jgi:hypothetical protein
MSVSRLAVFISVRIYRWLLFIYPASFRREYGSELVILFEDMAKDAIFVGGLWGLMRLWLLVLSELWDTAREQHVIAGSYYIFRRVQNRLWQAAISLTGLVLGFVYLLKSWSKS